MDKRFAKTIASLTIVSILSSPVMMIAESLTKSEAMELDTLIRNGDIDKIEDRVLNDGLEIIITIKLDRVKDVLKKDIKKLDSSDIDRLNKVLKEIDRLVDFINSINSELIDAYSPIFEEVNNLKNLVKLYQDAESFNEKVQEQLEDFDLDHSLEMLDYYNNDMPKSAKELVDMEKVLEWEIKVKEGLRDREETEAIKVYEKAIIDAETLNDLDELREKVNQDERLSEEVKEDLNESLGIKEEILRNDHFDNIYKEDAESFNEKVQEQLEDFDLDHSLEMLDYYNNDMPKSAKELVDMEKVLEWEIKVKEGLRDREETEAIKVYEKAIIDAETLNDLDELREKVNQDERLSEEVKEDLNESLDIKEEVLRNDHFDNIYKEDAKRFNAKVQDQLKDFNLDHSLEMLEYYNDHMPKSAKELVDMEKLLELEEKVKIALKDDEETEAVREYEKAIIDAETLEDVDNLREKVNSDERLSEEVKEDLNESLNNKKELILKEIYEEDAERFNLKVQDQLNDFDLKESLDMIDYFNNDMPKYGKDFVNLDELRKLEEKVKIALKDDEETEAVREYEKAIIDAETLEDVDNLREKVNSDERLSEEVKEDLNESLDIKEEVLRNEIEDLIDKMITLKNNIDKLITKLTKQRIEIVKYEENLTEENRVQFVNSSKKLEEQITDWKKLKFYIDLNINLLNKIKNNRI